MALERQEREAAHMRGVSAIVVEHLAEPLSVERLAQLAGIGARSLSRWCERELGETPAKLVRRLRLEEARRLLEQTALPLKAIAAQTGIGDSSTLWRVFIRSFGISPAQYRAGFAVRRS
jgi:transcriptional regulator GlxA family with amidase domain